MLDLLNSSFIKNRILFVLVMGIIAVFLFILGSHFKPDSPDQPTPTLGGQAAERYIGTLTNNDGVIALIVSQTQARGMICSRNTKDWRDFSVWFSAGTHDANAINLANPTTGAKIAAQLSGDSWSGSYTNAAGQAYPFMAKHLAPDTAEGIYKRDNLGIVGVNGPASLKVILSDSANGTNCGLIAQGDMILSRAVTAVWQAGFGTFALPDITGTSPVGLTAPGQLGFIEAIAAPTSSDSTQAP